MSPFARILAQGFFTPAGVPDLVPAGDAPLAPSLGLLPRTLRRGLSGLTRSVLSASEQALSGLDPEASVPAVFASRYGEIQTAVELMRRAQEYGESSPARFRHSVQNTCLGLLSLARGDVAPNTALSAGEHTLSMALLEAFLLLADGAPRVLVAVADEPVPEALGKKPLGAGGAVAFLLASPDETDHQGLWLSRPVPVERPEEGPSEQPLGRAFALFRRVASAETGVVDLGGRCPQGWAATLRHPSATGTEP